MKTHKKKGHLITFLVGHYIIFTILVVLALFFTMHIYTYLANGKLLSWSDETPSVYEDVLKNGQYENFPSERIFGENSAFAILNENEQLIYTSNNEHYWDFTHKEIFVIPPFDKTIFVQTRLFSKPSGEYYTSVSRYLNTFSGDYEQYITILDENYNIVFTTELNQHLSLNESEYNLFALIPQDGQVISKYQFESQPGKMYTMLIRSDDFSDQTINQTKSAVQMSFFIFAFMYLILLALFVFHIYHKIQKPLNMLEKAMLELPAHPDNVNIDYTGPSEFVQIFDRFEKMSECLALSEQENRTLQKDRQTMLADISHDLKTPITIISGYAKALSEGIVPPENTERYLHTIAQKADRLTELINTFSEYNKLEHPTYTLSPEKVDICEFCRQYIAEKYDEIERLDYKFSVNIPEDVIYYPIDVFHMVRVFDNLLANAMKHNPVGTALFFELEQTNDFIILRVADNGTGVAPEVSSRIFKPFAVGNASRNNNGSGLGLSIVQRIVLLHNGTISLKQPPESKYITEFEIKFPR